MAQALCLTKSNAGSNSFFWTTSCFFCAHRRSAPTYSLGDGPFSKRRSSSKFDRLGRTCGRSGAARNVTASRMDCVGELPTRTDGSEWECQERCEQLRYAIRAGTGFQVRCTGPRNDKLVADWPERDATQRTRHRGRSRWRAVSHLPVWRGREQSVTIRLPSICTNHRPA